MRIDRQQQIRHELERSLATWDRHKGGDDGDLEYDAAMQLAQAARNLLRDLEDHDGEEPGFRVRMTSYGGLPVGAGVPMHEGDPPIADRYMQAIPAAGDLINSPDGTLRVNEVVWNFDPRIPADVVLFLITPEEEAAQRFENGEDDPQCNGCGKPYGEHCSDALECPTNTPGIFDTHRRFEG